MDEMNRLEVFAKDGKILLGFRDDTGKVHPFSNTGTCSEKIEVVDGVLYVLVNVLIPVDDVHNNNFSYWSM